MGAGGALALVTMLAVQVTSVLADGTVSPPNPVGEAVYRPHQLLDLVPLAVIVCAPLLVWLLRAIQRKSKMVETKDAGSRPN